MGLTLKEYKEKRIKLNLILVNYQDCPNEYCHNGFDGYMFGKYIECGVCNGKGKIMVKFGENEIHDLDE